jgi:membrane protein DedA with SNARE-associated domain
MKNLIATLIAWGPAGLFVAALLDGAGVPVPGGVDVLIVFLATYLPDQVLWLTAVAVIGSVAGNLFLFLLARRGGQMFLDRRSQGKGARRFRSWFDHYGLLTVFVSALVPLPVMPMKIFVISAGALGARLTHFAGALGLARVARYGALAYLGSAMGDNSIQYLRDHAIHLTAFAILLFLFLVALVKWSDRRREALR